MKNGLRDCLYFQKQIDNKYRQLKKAKTKREKTYIENKIKEYEDKMQQYLKNLDTDSFIKFGKKTGFLEDTKY